MRETMHWNKCGRIYSPLAHAPDEGFLEYAQSPQTLVFDSFVRVYFASRKRDKFGKPVSHIRYVDFDNGLQEIIGHSQHDVLGPGKTGCFDEHGVFPLNIVSVDNTIYGYTNGWSRRQSVSIETGIGLVFSRDGGHTFERYGDGPVLSASLHEPVLVGDPCVQFIEGQFHMWYIFGTGWKVYSPGAAPDRIYKIGYATSNDGVTWNKSGQRLVTDCLGPDECQALPTVIHDDGRYHMFFCFRQPSDFRNNSVNAYRIGYAVSTDLITWKRNDAFANLTVSPDGWDSEMMCYPHAFKIDGKIHLLYNGNQFGRDGFGLAVLDYLPPRV